MKNPLGGIFGSSPKVELPKLEDIQDILRLQQDYTQTPVETPFGGVRYNNTNNPLQFDQWLMENPTQQGGGEKTQQWTTNQKGDMVSNWVESGTRGSTHDDYQNYLDAFDPGPKNAEFYLSDEGQTLYDKIFDENAYDDYGQEYKDNFRNRFEPRFDRSREDLEQSMANRGAPIGGDLYNDKYRLLEQAINDAYMASDATAMGIAENARINDYNQLMGMFGASQVNGSQVNPMDAYNLALGVGTQNANADAMDSQNMWNTISGLGSAYVTGGMVGDDPFWLKG